MAGNKHVKLACVVLVYMIVLGVTNVAEAAMTCNQVTGNLIPCIAYLQKGGNVPGGCCNGIRNIMNSAKTTVDRQAACNCLKSAAASARGINPRNAETLPGKCGLNIPYKISASTNCASIK